MMEALPALPGSYVLHLLLQEPVLLAVGRSGSFAFSPGSYLYFGSAFGQGGLRARLAHHLRGTASPRWHIDYLRRLAAPVGGWYSTQTARLECRWSQRLSQQPGVLVPAPGFGAADCRQGCAAHLLYLPEWQPQALGALLAQVAQQPVYRFAAGSENRLQ